MIKPFVLRNSAEPEIVIGIALKLFYETNDWVENSEFLDGLDREYDAIGRERETRTGGQAIAKYKPALYYGLLDARQDGARRINDYGRRYYEAYVAKNNDEMVDCLISSISSHLFGRDNPAVPESHSRIEPPKVFIVSCLLLNNKLSKTEYAYILEQLSNDKDYRQVLVEVAISRLNNSELALSTYARNNYKDDKGLKFLADAGFFDEERGGFKSIKQKYVLKYSNKLSSLSIFSEEVKPARITLTQNNIPNNSKVMNYLTAIRTKPFILLAGISGTGKSRIVREFAFKSCPKYLQDKDGTTPGNYCMIEVKPNWHDSTELLGYYSHLGQSGYQFKKFVKFLIKAMMFPDVPFFVCLDEMNLAPVEQYFAEVLSILETRKHPKIIKDDGSEETDMNIIKTEVIVEARYFQELAVIKNTKNIDTGKPLTQELTDRDIYLKLNNIDTEDDIDPVVGNQTNLTTKGLTLPDNVIIIGTVNMDDTTHQFSRKVIDRAMTIEMNGGKLADMFGGSRDLEYLEEEEQQKWQYAFRQHYVTADEVLEKHPELAKDITEKLPERLEEINQVLKGTPFEVSYRVLNELTIMVGVMLDEKGKEANIDDVINQAVDNILLMKILPRIEGDSEMFAIKGSNKTRLDLLKEIAPTIEPAEKGTYRQTAKDKIQEMIDRLNNQEFTRFWP